MESFAGPAGVVIVAAAYVLVTWPTGKLIGRLTRAWQAQLVAAYGQGLRHGGLWIGCLERLLILTFVLLNQYQPIGFLLAAKSILRFGEVSGSKPENRKMAEYVIIGTMLSMLIALLVGIGASAALRAFASATPPATRPAA